jgi:LysM repeat protein
VTGAARRGGSRWLPSFLSRDPHEETGTSAVAARTGPAAAVSAAATLPADTWADDGTEAPDLSLAAATGAVAVMAPPPSRGPTEVAPVVATAGAAADGAADPDPPGSLAPRRRRQPPGVPVDASAPTARQSQTRPATRAKGSGEWNQPKTATAGSGWRRILPGGLPPLLLGAGALFLGALALFLLPGMLAGGGDTPTPVPTIEVGGGVAASLGPDASIAPTETEPPAGEFQPYVVERGDTLIDIARRFSVSQEVLICANRELRRNPNLLSVGQELQIPPEDWACPSQAKPTKKPGKKAAATEPPAASVTP